MIILQSSYIDIARYITHPISLIAYVCALTVYYFVSKNISDRKKLEANPRAYVKTAERLNLDLSLIREEERGVITLQVLKNRIISQTITAISLIIGGLLISYLFIRYIKKEEALPSEHGKQSTEITSSKEEAPIHNPTPREGVNPPIVSNSKRVTYYYIDLKDKITEAEASNKIFTNKSNITYSPSKNKDSTSIEIELVYDEKALRVNGSGLHFMDSTVLYLLVNEKKCISFDKKIPEVEQYKTKKDLVDYADRLAKNIFNSNLDENIKKIKSCISNQNIQ